MSSYQKQNKSYSKSTNSYKLNKQDTKNSINSWTENFEKVNLISENFSTQKLSKYLDTLIEIESKLPENSENVTKNIVPLLNFNSFQTFVIFLTKIIPLVKISKEELILSKLMNLITKISQKNEVKKKKKKFSKNFFLGFFW